MNLADSAVHSPASDFSTLTPNGLIALLAQEGDRTSMELIDACIAHGEAMVQSLAAHIDDDATWETDSIDAWWLPFHAALILGRMESESSGLLLVHLMQKIDESNVSDLQDWLAGDWAALFRNKPARVIDAMRSLTMDTSLRWYTRCQGLEVILDNGMRHGPEALETAIDWVAGLANNASDEWEFRIITACGLLDFPRPRHRPMLESMAAEEAQRAKQAGSFVGMFAQEDVDSAFSKAGDRPGWERRKDPWSFYSPEAIAARQERWQEEENDLGFEEEWPVSLPYVRTTHKIGRNDPCPCGSGKKYKRCCLIAN
ncbi:MAG: SEC-C domain-containing protein [Dokdonella sp.]|nr:SEC-C domain-containing protein [Dokdonella sp.]